MLKKLILKSKVILSGSLVQALKLNPDMATERINVEVSKDQLTREKRRVFMGARDYLKI